MKRAAEQEEPSALAAEFSLKQVSRTVHQGGRFFVSFDGNQVKKCRDSHGFCPIHPVKL